MTYKKDTYYEGLGTYLGTRITYSYTGSSIKEHLFTEGIYDANGAAKLNRLTTQGDE